MVETSVDSSHNNTNSKVLKAAEIKNVCSKEVTVGKALRYYKELEQSKDHNIE